VTVTSGHCGVDAVAVDGRLHGITFDLPAGAVTAVVGGDGAGKSTLLELLVGALVPDEGTVHAPRDPRLVGYAPTGAGFYADLTVDENVHFVATAYRLGGTDLARRRAEVLELTGLAGFGERLARVLADAGLEAQVSTAAATLEETMVAVARSAGAP
jgi:ABC-2 type transport system ATP-binding protein